MRQYAGQSLNVQPSQNYWDFVRMRLNKRYQTLRMATDIQYMCIGKIPRFTHLRCEKKRVAESAIWTRFVGDHLHDGVAVHVDGHSQGQHEGGDFLVYAKALGGSLQIQRKGGSERGSGGQSESFSEAS